MHGRLAIIVYARRSFSRSRVLGRATAAVASASASNLLRAITHGSVPDISRSPPRFAFNFVPDLHRASARGYPWRAIFILLSARAPGIATCGGEKRRATEKREEKKEVGKTGEKRRKI